MRLLRFSLAALLLGCLALVVTYRIKDPERIPLDERARAEALPVDSAAHLPHLEQPDVVVPAVVRFLRGEPSRP
jgi:pimeloyl-ACP methyl ester carboxylesterase